MTNETLETEDANRVIAETSSIGCGEENVIIETLLVYHCFKFHAQTLISKDAEQA